MPEVTRPAAFGQDTMSVRTDRFGDRRAQQNAVGIALSPREKETVETDGAAMPEIVPPINVQCAAATNRYVTTSSEKLNPDERGCLP